VRPQRLERRHLAGSCNENVRPQRPERRHLAGPKQWPVRVKNGHSTVSIYRIERKKNGRSYTEFKLAYYNEVGKRTFQSFSSYARARRITKNLPGICRRR
jgi:hypothetical protein